ncbi:MAG: methylated-DNA--[protein]-cysteine S-methyltransferase [Pseudomonadota bacterium]
MNTSADATATASLDERAAAYRTIAAALHWLQAQADAPPALADLAAHVGLSEFHLQRLFSRWAGLSPKRFLQHLARERAQEALLAGQDLLGASLAAGLSGPGRLHDLMVSCTAATPGEIKSGGAGLRIGWGVAATPFGPALLAASGRGLMQLSFLEDASASPAALAELQQAWPAAGLARDDAAAQALARRIFAAYREPEPLPLFVKGTQFQLRVWEALLKIPEGRLITYGTLAQSLGQPGASRAVGSAVGANPVALLIPCHRVIRSSGVLGGYRWGETRKRLLVAAELARHAPASVEPVTK